MEYYPDLFDCTDDDEKDYHSYDCICENCLQNHPERDLLYNNGEYFTYPKDREEVKSMKLYATVVAAFAGLVYAIMRAYAPDLPFSQDQILAVIYLALAWLGVMVTEERIRAFMIRRGFNGFK